MHTLVSITGLELSPEKADELTAIYPEGRHGPYRFSFRLPQDDPRTLQILEWLEDHGYKPKTGTDDQDYRCEYLLAHVYEYDTADLAEAAYMELAPTIYDDTISDVDRDEQGRLRLRRQAVKSSRLDVGRAVLGYVVVPERVKTVLEAQDLKHLAFKPTVAAKGTGLAEERCTPVSWESVGVPPWWELTSDLTLPPLSPSMDLRDDLGNRITPAEAAMGCVPKDGFYNHAELHYRRSDLAQVEPFDVACTFESFGPRSPIQRSSIIVSQRFYQVCVRNRLKTKWIPVRIDDD